jgi:hypothetical protein
MTETSDFIDRIAPLVERIGELQRIALVELKPVVERIIRSGSRDARSIEQTLDRLLDFCGNDDVLMLYRRLCRHYFDIDPAATASYVNSYREMYDSESDHFSEAKR